MWDCRRPSTKWKVSVSVCVELSLPSQVVSCVNGMCVVSGCGLCQRRSTEHGCKLSQYIGHREGLGTYQRQAVDVAAYRVPLYRLY